MRKMLVLAIVMLISITATEIVKAQSQIYSAGKSLSENRRTTRLIKKQISYYEAKLDSSLTDSALITGYRQKINFLEDQLDNLVAGTASEPNRQAMNLKSNDPVKVAEAYMITKYAENGRSASVSGDSAIVLNYSFYPTRVDVQFCGRRLTSFALPGITNRDNPAKMSFKIPGPGNYLVTYTNIQTGGTVAAGRFVDCVSREQGGYAFLSTYCN